MHERHGDGCKCRSGYRKSIVEYITNLLAAREKEAYQIGKEDGYAESESNYHFEDAEKECIKQTRNETVKECVKAIESINLNEICDDSTVVARNKIIEVLLALRSEKVDDAG